MADTGDNKLPVRNKQPEVKTFRDLQDKVNKLIESAKEEEARFIEQTKNLNAWDEVVNNNAESLAHLTDTLNNAKENQNLIGNDLECIAVQLNDVEASICAYEKIVEDSTSKNTARSKMYAMATKIDAQLKRTSEEMKYIIEDLNESHLHDNTDTISQIGRILDAQLDSLQWIDDCTSQVFDYIQHLKEQY